MGLNLEHDTSASLVKDGRLIGAVEEERFDRQKHTTSFPHRAIKYLLEREGITADEVEFAVSWDYPSLNSNSEPWELDTILGHDLYGRRSQDIRVKNKFALLRVRDQLEFSRIQVSEWVPHHKAHAVGAYYLSGLDPSNIMVIDGRGEAVSTSLMYGSKGEIRTLQQYPVKDSLGHVYTYVSYLCGYYNGVVNEGEGKVMGMAGYGKSDPKLESDLDKVVRVTKGRYTVSRAELTKLSTHRCNPNSFNTKSKDLAFCVQKYYVKALLSMARELTKKTGCENFVLAGGVSLNCDGNGILAREKYVHDIYIQPSANDGGSSIGAALHRYCRDSRLIPQQEDVYLGPIYTNDEIENTLSKCKVQYEKVSNPYTLAAELLASGKIIGWFQGGMEFGPRALGNRSILANPHDPKMRDEVNKIKWREIWRPLAPALNLEDMAEYFAYHRESPHMTITFQALPKAVKEIPSAIHVNGTARVQTVTRKRNEKFYLLIKKFKDITGVPAVINTSFNLRHEPIVCSPNDALSSFYGSGLDALIIGDYVIKKSTGGKYE